MNKMVVFLMLALASTGLMADASQSDTYALALKFYEGGAGYPRNYKAAYEFSSAAAKAGNLEATNLLGILHENGQGVGKNLFDAYALYCISAAHGSENARKNMDRMESYMPASWVSKAQDYALQAVTETRKPSAGGGWVEAPASKASYRR